MTGAGHVAGEQLVLGSSSVVSSLKSHCLKHAAWLYRRVCKLVFPIVGLLRVSLGCRALDLGRLTCC